MWGRTCLLSNACVRVGLPAPPVPIPPLMDKARSSTPRAGLLGSAISCTTAFVCWAASRRHGRSDSLETCKDTKKVERRPDFFVPPLVLVLSSNRYDATTVRSMCVYWCLLCVDAACAWSYASPLLDEGVGRQSLNPRGETVVDSSNWPNATTCTTVRAAVLRTSPAYSQIAPRCICGCFGFQYVRVPNDDEATTTRQQRVPRVTSAREGQQDQPHFTATIKQNHEQTRNTHSDTT